MIHTEHYPTVGDVGNHIIPEGSLAETAGFVDYGDHTDLIEVFSDDAAGNSFNFRGLPEHLTTDGPQTLVIRDNFEPDFTDMVDGQYGQGPLSPELKAVKLQIINRERYLVAAAAGLMRLRDGDYWTNVATPSRLSEYNFDPETIRD
ncbi:MAG: hypothetical protein ABIQ04_01395 [Candidatus Saccharimonadales bacterium]